MAEVNFDNPFILQSSVVDREDVDQEIALLKLQGITARRSIVQLRMSQENAEAIFQGDPGSLAQPIGARPLPPAMVVQQLIEWAVEQSDEIGRAVLSFLAEPDDDELEVLVSQLRRSGLTTNSTKTAKGTLSSTLTAYLTRAPRTKEDLYDYARTLHQAARPEAAVRQYLRRGIREGLLELVGDQYRVNSSK